MRRSSFWPLRLTAFVLFCSVFATSVAYAADVPLDAGSAKKMLEARGVGKMVKVKQADGKVLRAKIVSIGDDSVVMQDGKKAAVTVPYSKMTAVKEPGLSDGAVTTISISIGVLIALGVASHFYH